MHISIIDIKLLNSELVTVVHFSNTFSAALLLANQLCETIIIHPVPNMTLIITCA